MNDRLSRELLRKVTGWKGDKLTKERKDLQLLADYKYDEYKQFSTGMRFIESLSLWLSQFKEVNMIPDAYNLIKNNLVFISQKELEHLICITYPDFIKPYLTDHQGKNLSIKNHLVKKLNQSEKFKILKLKCLFLGLSDGSHIDILRRSAELSHEQVYSTYFIPKEKSDEMLLKLHDDIKKITNKDNNEKYSIVFLVDDFSGSGISYLRLEGKEFNGKISKFYKQLCVNHKNSPSESIFDMDNLKICVVLYVATERARLHINKLSKELVKNSKHKIDVIVVQKLDSSHSLTATDLGKLSVVLKNKFKNDVLTKHYKKGKYNEPYLGFDECGLLLVLSHNCPNNSLPIIWHHLGSQKALFPRLDRHGV